MPPKRHRRGAAPISPPSFSSSSWYFHHCNERFFSSLRQVEDRLASDISCSRQSPHVRFSPLQQRKRPASPLLSSPDKSTEPFSLSSSPSYSAPLFIDRHRAQSAQRRLAVGDSSDPAPLELFSDSILHESPPSFPVEGGPPRTTHDDATGDVQDDVERLVDLLGLSELYQGGTGGSGDGNGEGSHGWPNGAGDQDGRFLSKIAGVKGPKCHRELARLDDWIRYYLYRRSSTGGGSRGKVKNEPARLAHLLLARAVCMGRDSDDDCGSDYFGEVGFPATVEEYLQHNPPTQASSLL